MIYLPLVKSKMIQTVLITGPIWYSNRYNTDLKSTGTEWTVSLMLVKAIFTKGRDSQVLQVMKCCLNEMFFNCWTTRAQKVSKTIRLHQMRTQCKMAVLIQDHKWLVLFDINYFCVERVVVVERWHSYQAGWVRIPGEARLFWKYCLSIPAGHRAISK